MPQSRWIMVGIGLLVVAAGLVPMLDALGVFAGSDSRMNAPRWVVFLAGSLFFTCGMWVIMLGFVGESRAQAFGVALGVALLLGMTLIVNWIAFGGGHRNDCSGGVSALGITLTHGAAEMECRVAFGYGAMLLNAFLLRGLTWWWVKCSSDSRSARVADKIAEWGIGLLLLPIFMLLAAPDAIKKVREKLAVKQKPKGP